MNIGISGISGRMGRAVLDIVLNKGYTLACAFDAPDSPYKGKDAGIFASSTLGVTVTRPGPVTADVLIDFSTVQAAESVVSFAVESRVPLVIGTTGFSAAEKDAITRASEIIPVLFSPNMSLGINLLFKLTEIAAQALNGRNFDAEILELHHRLKKDAPSGTALRLLEIVKENSSTLASAAEITGRQGMPGERTDSEIGIFAVRGGDIVGEHTVFYIGAGERIELTHRASNRATLARGAVTAAEFLAGKKPGMYSMFDVLGFS